MNRPLDAFFVHIVLNKICTYKAILTYETFTGVNVTIKDGTKSVILTQMSAVWSDTITIALFFKEITPIVRRNCFLKK
jgi:hypothetical protein